MGSPGGRGRARNGRAARGRGARGFDHPEAEAVSVTQPHDAFDEPTTSTPKEELEPPNNSDLGNAHRFIADHVDTVRYVPEWRRWFVWDGTRWIKDEMREVWRLAKATVRGLYAAADYSEDDAGRRALLK